MTYSHPLILITAPTHAQLKPFYAAAVSAAGGLPLAAHPLAAALAFPLMQRADGLLLSGGGDASPALFPQLDAAIPPRGVDEERDLFEQALIMAALSQGKPILAICRGMQLLNLCLGGDLHQHIEGHDQEEPPELATQPVELIEPLLAAWLGRDIAVNSHHHQAVRQLGVGLAAAALAGDGLVEAIIAPGLPFVLGVQWHPERLRQQLLFSRFTAAAAGCIIKR